MFFQIATIVFVQMSLYALLAKSFEIIYKTSSLFLMTHAISITLGAYIVFYTSISLQWPFWVSILLSIIVVILLMLVVHVVIYEPLQNKDKANWEIMIVSLGIYVVLQNSISMIWGDDILSFRTSEIKEGHVFIGSYITDVQIITIIVCFVLLFLCWLIMENTNVGKSINAVSSNKELSTVLGISKEETIRWSIGIGTSMAVCAGILIAADTDMNPTMGFNWLLYAVVAMIIGGMGKMRHLFLGSLLLAVAQQLVAYYLDNKWTDAVAYIILIIFLIFRPSGFSGKQIKKINL